MANWAGPVSLTGPGRRRPLLAGAARVASPSSTCCRPSRPDEARYARREVAAAAAITARSAPSPLHRCRARPATLRLAAAAAAAAALRTGGNRNRGGRKGGGEGSAGQEKRAERRLGPNRRASGDAVLAG